MTNLKQQVHAHYRQSILDKIAMIEKVLDDLKESGRNETKSTAGDKHETALAMLQIEQENKRRQLKELQEQLTAFNKIDISVQSSKVIPGSLVLTNKGYFFVSIAGGKANINQLQVIALSPQSPLGTKLMGARVNDTVEMNGVVFHIEAIE